jgi:protease-4
MINAIMRILPRKPFKWLLLAFTVVTVAITLRSLFATPTIEPGSYLMIDVTGEYDIAPPGNVLDQLVDDRRVLASLIGGLDRARFDDRIDGAILRIHELEIGWARLREIRDAIGRLRTSNKRVVAYLDTATMGANKEYYLATAADDIFVPPASAPMLSGLSARYIFFGGLWNSLKLGVQVEQIREFKGFGDQIGGREMTEPLREMANSILDDLNDEFIASISEARGMGRGEVEAIVDSCPATAADFVEAGLADDQLFLDQILVDLGDGERIETVRLADYNREGVAGLFSATAPKIAVIYANGTIVAGKGGRRSIAGSSIGSYELAKAFRKAADDPEIEAIVFRLNSPGGSPLGSDHVWHAAMVAAEKKPVVASFSDVAASGGYYMAAAADLIVAEPTTLTGSIGVVLIRPNISDLLERYDIGTETIGRGRYSSITDISRPMNEAELALIREQMASTYRLFLDRVAVGRGMTVEEVDALGGGRVWTGRQALDRGLVDRLGGLDDAVRLAATEAGLADPDNVSRVHLPERRGLIQEFLTPLTQTSVDDYLPSGLSEFARALALYAPLDAGVYALSSAIFQVH